MMKGKLDATSFPNSHHWFYKKARRFIGGLFLCLEKGKLKSGFIDLKNILLDF